MELIKFRIKNYKSIIDSGDCYFSDKLTILAGKNESGKTSILEALEDFHQDKKIRDEAKPIDGNGIPEIFVSFQLSIEEINKILIDSKIEQSFKTKYVITLSKKYDSNVYVLDEESRKKINLQNNYSSTKIIILNSLKIINAIFKKSSLSAQCPNPNFAIQRLAEYKKELINFKDQTLVSLEISEADKLLCIKEIEKIDQSIDVYYEIENKVSTIVSVFVESKMPYFILFSSFEHEFPKSIDIAGLNENEWAKDLEQVSSFEISKITSVRDQERRNHQELVNTEFTAKFKKFWTQDDIKLQVEKDGLKINFWIVENGRQYYPTQRSKGQQWYLSFYIKIVARLNEDKPNVILIDEPGLYLHAKAQRDLLAVLTEYASEYPVVFSTHSPYLIKENNLENVRLIEKKEGGTKILGKIHSHLTASKETLTPILTAIGLGINDSITNINQKNNVIVEGPEDVFYLQAFKILFNNELAINFINGGGAGNMGVVGAILEGWGADVYYLYDNDQGKKDGEKILKHEWKVLSDMIKVVLNIASKTIADILSIEDFKKFVLEKPELKYTIANSEYIKNNKLEKVLLARKFLQKVKTGGVIIDSISNKNIVDLFNEIDFKHGK